MNGHFSGRIDSAINNANEKTTGKDGSFYSILNSYGFYDISDEKNELTPWQRAQVPQYNQNRMSDLSSAVSDMLTDFLSNSDYGVLTQTVQDIVDKLDARAAMTQGEMDAVGGALGTITQGTSEASRQGMSGLIASMMGTNKFDPDLIPPISIGFSGLPVSISNCFKPGFFVPNWQFLYEHETVKSPIFYDDGSGKLHIGAGIPLDIGGKQKIMVLKQIFSVLTVENNLTPQGDAETGLSSEEFDIIISASNKNTISELTDKEKEFKLTDKQIQMSFYKYVQIVLWGTIINKNNWAYLHWGAVSHNSCPEPIKTAVCSYLWTNGLSISTDINSESAFISYCLRTGISYLIGFDKKIKLVLMPNMKYIDNNKKVITVDSSYNSNVPEIVYGVPKDKNLANIFFTYIADVLCRLTSSSSPDNLDIALRKRRIDEANLIYGYVGYNRFSYGTELTNIDRNCLSDGLVNRQFAKLINSQVPTYENKAITLSDPTDITIKINNGVVGTLTDRTKNVIRYIARRAGIPGVVITSVYRSPSAQARVMYDNRQSANGEKTVSYALPGKTVDNVYDNIYKKYHGSPVKKFTNSSEGNEAKLAMESKVEEYAKTTHPVSRHCSDPTYTQAVDIGPNGTRSAFKLSEAQLKKFHQCCIDVWKEGYLRQYFGPKEYGYKGNDPAFHIEVEQTTTLPTDMDSENTDITILPQLEVSMKNTNLLTKSSWDIVLLKDVNDKGNTNG